jgi:iron complex outermembrane receptor protein
LSLSTASHARAQEEDQQEDSAEAEAEFSQEIVVMSTHPELPASSEISGEQVRSGASKDLAGALREQPGLDAASRGPMNLDPNVRGLVETQLGTFVDGTRLFAAGPARMDTEISHVSPQMVERLRVVKGPYALTWGAGTLGAINVETYKPGFNAGGMDVQGSGGALYGDNASTLDVFGGVAGSGSRSRFNLILNHRTGDDYEDGDGNLIPGDYESSEGRLNFGFQIDDSSVLDLLVGYQEQFDIDYPGRLLDATYFYTRSYGLEWSKTMSGSVSEVFVQLYNNRKDHLMNNDEKPTAQPNPNRIPPFPLQVDLPTESNTAGARGFATWGSGDWLWQAGADYYNVEQTATRFISRRDAGMLIFTDIVWPDSEIEDLGGYFQGIYRKDRFELGATVRVDLVDVSAGEVSDFFLENTTGELDQSETNPSVALSARWALADGWSLTAGLGQAVRTATSLERYADRFPSTKFQIATEFVGQPDIDPETGRQLDLGVLYTASNMAFQANLFYRTIDDYITVEPDPDLPRRLPVSPMLVYRHLNGDEAETLGGELHFDHQVNRWFGWRAGLTYLDTEDTFFNEPVFGTPPPAAQIGFTLSEPAGRYWADFGVRIVDDQDDVAEARFEQPTEGYEVFDLRGGYRLASGLILKAGVENLTDELYTNHLNSLNPFNRARIPETGRNVFVAVEFRP